jgi:hypothetical protein
MRREVMRDIKFRGKRVDNEKLVYGYYFNIDGTDYILEKGTGFFTIHNGEEVFGSAYVHEVIHESVGQFTGLHDKNSKEIYESDLVKSSWGGIGIVTFGKYHDDGGLDGPVDFIGYYVTWVDDSKSHVDLTTFEVIGNIYENPELLGGATMTEQSKVTLQPLPTLEEIMTDMVQLYLDERGYGDLFDSMKTLLPITPEKIGITLYQKIEEVNEKEMKSNGLCPDCGGKLVRKGYKATKDSPGAEWIECQDCHDEVRAV